MENQTRPAPPPPLPSEPFPSSFFSSKPAYAANPLWSQSMTALPPDPFNVPRSSSSRFMHALLATALFRCWHLLLFFSGWATAICVISDRVQNIGIQATLLTVLGTVLGFVISYRTTSSFERYNEGRRYWSQIVLASRTFARLVWFHVPDTMDIGAPGISSAEKQARVLVEKKTVINLLEAFAVSVKHYLRGEEGIFYVDLYHLVKYLPAYALPAGLPSAADLHAHSEDGTAPFNPVQRSPTVQRKPSRVSDVSATRQNRLKSISSRDEALPLPATTPGAKDNGAIAKEKEHAQTLVLPVNAVDKERLSSPGGPRMSLGGKSSANFSLGGGPVEDYLLPARQPPKYSYLDIFPFSLLVKFLTKRGKELSGAKAARLRAKLRHAGVSHNLPHEISLYLSSYVAALQARKAIDAPTTTTLLATVTQLVDALTGLERILTTPIPFSYSIHLWSVTLVYLLVLPFQLWNTLRYITIPGTAIAAFIFLGFLVAGEEIENPFGYDKNDLNMDHFTSAIIREELRAITAAPAPDPALWAFGPANDAVFDDERVPPEEWVARGKGRMMAALAGTGRSGAAF